MSAPSSDRALAFGTVTRPNNISGSIYGGSVTPSAGTLSDLPLTPERTANFFSAALPPNNPPSNTSTITSNFNGTSIAAGDYIWFNSVMKVSGVPSSGATVTISGATVQFTVNNANYDLAVPDSVVTFSSSASSSTTTFDAVHDLWETTVPTSYSGNVFVAGLSEPLSSSLPGGINPVTWTATFYTNTSGVSVNWQWAAAVYTQFNTSYSALGVKPIDASTGSDYLNSDHAGTPENYKSYVIGGARGGGGSNWTGSYSGTGSVVPEVATNPAPVANAGPDQMDYVQTTVQLDGTASYDTEGLAITYDWSFASIPTGSSATLSDPTNPKPTFFMDVPGNYTVQLVVSDGVLNSAPSQVVISTKNSPPVANAGPDQQITAGTTVQLDGSKSSDVDGDPLTYQWSFQAVPSGSEAQISNATAVNPTFYADKQGTYVVQLIVNDGTYSSNPSLVTITSANAPPVANAGPNQILVAGTTVQLDGSGSTDVDGDSLTYSWSFLSVPEGSTATVSNPSIVNPTFYADKIGTYVAQLIVNDGTVNSQPATVTISSLNAPPVANAGPAQTVTVGSTVQLDGSHSTDVDGDSLTYRWSILTMPTGSAAALSNATDVQPTFVADRVGTYVVQLIVNDGTTDSQPASVMISTGDVPPVANPGPNQSVTAGNTVTLNGAGSTDSDSQSLTYSWSLLTTPSGSNAALSSTTTANPTFVADLPGTYIIQLIVNDGYLNSSPATVMISTGDVPPVANPGPNQTVIAGMTVQLDGTGSTSALGFPLTYSWAILTQPSGGNATLSSTTAAKPTFVPNVAGLYVIQLIVNDGYLNSQPQTITVTANPQYEPPTVSAGSDQSIELPADSTTLSGSAVSTAPAGSPVTVQWTQVSGPGTVAFADATQPVTQATFPLVGTYVLELTGTVAATGLSSSARATITLYPVNQPPTVNAGPNEAITLPANTVTLNGSATDDGLPPGSKLQISWTKLLGPGNVTFGNSGSAATSATFVLPGVYELQLSATDGQYTSTSDTTVTVNPPVGGILAVNAGQNQITTFPANVALSGAVTDLIPAPGGTPTLLWSQVSGPGTASFASTSATQTSVSFNQPGVYDLRLTATDSGFSAASDVFVFLGHVQCTRSNAGTDFWLMFIGGEYVNTFPDQELDLFISGDAATSGTVTILGIGFTQTFTITPGQVSKVIVPESVMVKTSDTVETKGIHVTAQEPVSVYGLNYIPEASDGYTGLPAPMLGTSYVALGYANTYEKEFGTNLGTEFGITATQNGTTVTIAPAVTADGPTGSGSKRFGGVPYTIQLNQGQTYQLRNYTDGPNLTTDSGVLSPVDLSGSIISSDKPIAVFGGHDCVSLPTNNAACNHLVEELPPTDTWGQAFLTMPLALQTKGDTFRYLASTDNTHVTVNGTLVATLNRGQFFEQILTAPSMITADQPILVAQYSNSNSFSQPPTGGSAFVDPSMTLVPPFEQFGGAYTVSTPVLTFPSGPPYPKTQGFKINFLNVVAPTSAAQAGAILLDGVAIPANAFVPIQSSGFSGAQVPVSVGTHNLSATVPFGIWSYGWDYYDAYSYTGGYCLATGAQNGTVTLSPKTQSVQIPQQACVSAAAVDTFGNPQGGSGVSFQVSGVNSASADIPADGTGTAQFCYSSTATGTDSISATGGTASDTATVQWLAAGQPQPPVVTAGANQNIELPTNTVQVGGAATDQWLPSGSSLSFEWTMTSGPAAVTFTAPAQLSSTAAFTSPGTYVLQLAATDPQTLLTGTATTQITVYPVNQAPAVYAGPDQTIQLPTSTVTLSGTATDDGLPPGSKVTVQWSQLSGPSAATLSAPTQLTTQATFSSSGVYVFQLTASDTQLTSSSTVTITVQASDPTYVPPQVSAGQNLTIQLPINAATLNGSATDNGNPTGTTMTIAWSEISGPGTVNFSAPSQAVTQATFPLAGSYVLQLSANNGHFTSTSNVVVTVLPPDVPPTVATPPAQAIELPQSTALLNGVVTDNALPPGATLSISWSEVSGPGGVSFSAPSNAATLATFSSTGTYTLKLFATDGTLSSYATTAVTVYPVNQPPVVSAGASQTLDFFSNQIASNTSVALSGTVSDDGLPIGSKLAIQWTVLSGPGNVVFANPTSPTTTATFSNPGTYLLQLAASDGQYNTRSVITVNAIPVIVNAGGPYTATVNQPITLSGSMTANGQSVASQFPFLWIVTQQVPNYPPVLSPNPPRNTLTPQVTFPSTGTYTLALCLGSISTCDTYAASDVTFDVLPTNPPAAPSVAFTFLADGAQITAPMAITGSASGVSWTLSYALESDVSPENFIALASGSGPVTNATLGTLDPTLLLNGTYTLRLVSTDNLGQATTVETHVAVTRNMKIGVFSISFNDLTVPVAGIPIQIIRSYDSRDKSQGDFGTGWHLSLANIRIQKVRNMGLNWSETASASGFLPQYCLQPNNPSIVTITFPDGKVYEFQETATPSCQLAGPITAPTVGFQELPGATGTNGATLVPADGGSALVDGSRAGRRQSGWV